MQLISENSFPSCSKTRTCFIPFFPLRSPSRDPRLPRSILISWTSRSRFALKSPHSYTERRSSADREQASSSSQIAALFSTPATNAFPHELIDQESARPSRVHRLRQWRICKSIFSLSLSLSLSRLPASWSAITKIGQVATILRRVSSINIIARNFYSLCLVSSHDSPWVNSCGWLTVELPE